MQTLNEKLNFLLNEIERLSKKVEALENKKPALTDLTPLTSRVLKLENKKDVVTDIEPINKRLSILENKKPEIKETTITNYVKPEKLDIKNEIIDTIKSTVDLKYINNIYRNK